MAGSRNKPSADLSDTVSAVLARHIEPGQSLAVALSGGVDSVVLLDLAHRLQAAFGYRLEAVHVDHGLSPNAPAWAAFCERICGARNIPLRIHAVSVDRRAGRGIEAAARKSRYAVFAAAAADRLLTGHNRDDQVETVLMNLLRGSGPRGLGGMPELRLATSSGNPGLHILRPLLEVPRARIAAYAGWRGLEWIEDESNADTALTRNYLRRDLLPRLAERFPDLHEAIARSARWSAEAAHLLDVLAASDHDEWVDRGGRLDAGALAALDAARAKNLLRHWLQRHGTGLPDSSRLAEAMRQLVSAKPDAQIHIDFDSRVIRRFGTSVMLTRQAEEPPPATAVWDGIGSVSWGRGRIEFRRLRGDGIAADALANGIVTIRVRAGGERIRLRAGGPRRSLKNLFQEACVPPWERQALPLLWCGSDLVWVAKVGIAVAYRCPPGGDGWLPAWIEADALP